eukprot:TRINITY_DN894_c0_g1_i2.p1 TRINITY_DN894_c0_g1~~TRINITY_DN894_c0_g1_i2.p1  ORF type:complete len:257 (+),score=45.12 TRINITY_DN894_c0_g1_i2:63-833(+)
MAIGKNKRLGKKKGSKKKIVNPFLKKEWYKVQVPNTFRVRNQGWTPINKTQGTKISTELMKGRVFTINLADLNSNEESGYRNFKVIVDEVQKDLVLTSFYGMDLTRDKLCSLINKKQTLIEGNVDVKTTDGYTLRMFAVGFTDRRSRQVKQTCYAQGSQIRAIRKKMIEVMAEAGAKHDTKELMKEFIAESISTEMKKACAPIFPLKDVFVRKVKVLKRPKLDATKIADMHVNVKHEDTGAKVEREETLVGSGGRL